jgi:hypothetical protein
MCGGQISQAYLRETFVFFSIESEIVFVRVPSPTSGGIGGSKSFFRAG